MGNRTQGAAAVVALALIGLAGCSSGGGATPGSTAGSTAGSTPSSAPTSGASLPGEPTSSRTTSRPAAAAADAQVDKVLVFLVENHSLEQMRAEMPYAYDLATTYAYADHYSGLAHPSLPNYLAIAGGTTAGVTDDAPPSAHPLTGPSVFGQALAAGGTARVYADGMPEPCATDNGGNKYAVRHNPWAYFVDERDACLAHDLPLGPLAGDIASGDLPTVGLVVPNLCHDAHDCSLGVADRWIQDKIEAVQAGPDWQSGRLAIVVTADEDETKGDQDPDNRVLTVVAHPSLEGLVVHDPLTHLSLSRALSEVSGSRPLAEAAGATSLWAAFGLTPGG